MSEESPVSQLREGQWPSSGEQLTQPCSHGEHHGKAEGGSFTLMVQVTRLEVPGGDREVTGAV